MMKEKDSKKADQKIWIIVAVCICISIVLAHLVIFVAGGIIVLKYFMLTEKHSSEQEQTTPADKVEQSRRQNYQKFLDSLKVSDPDSYQVLIQADSI
ncbi:MAG: hypothetical protein ACP5FK_07340 [bacterium]